MPGRKMHQISQDVLSYLLSLGDVEVKKPYTGAYERTRFGIAEYLAKKYGKDEKEVRNELRSVLSRLKINGLLRSDLSFVEKSDIPRVHTYFVNETNSMGGAGRKSDAPMRVNELFSRSEVMITTGSSGLYRPREQGKDYVDFERVDKAGPDDTCATLSLSPVEYEALGRPLEVEFKVTARVMKRKK